MDRKGYSSGADTGAQPPSLTTPPSGPPAKRMRGRTRKSGESLPSPLSMSSSQSLADRRHRFCHLIITKRMRKREREQWQEVDVKEKVWWTVVCDIHPYLEGRKMMQVSAEVGGTVHAWGPWHTVTPLGEHTHTHHFFKSTYFLSYYLSCNIQI